jgi:tetratricopeptide (TPR) repeat protein
MHTHWLRYLWILVVLFVLAIIAVLPSMSVPRANTSSQLAPIGFPEYAPANEPAKIAESYQAFDNNDLDGALAPANDILSRNPGDIDALLAKASALAQKGSLEFKEQEYGSQAIQVAQQVLALDPNNAEAWRIIGYSYEIMQQYPAAHDGYAKAIAFDPKNALAVSGDAHAYDLQGNMDKAEAGYRRALSLDPNIAAAQLGLARILVYQNRLDDALKLYISVADAPGNARQRAEAAYSAGQIEEMQGEYAKAETRLRSSTTLDANYALGWTGLGSELFRQTIAKDSGLSIDTKTALMNESLADLAKATELNPNQSLAHYQLAKEMVALGRSSDALIILKGLKKQIIQNDITLSSIAKTAMQQKVQFALDALTKLQTTQ